MLLMGELRRRFFGAHIDDVAISSSRTLAGSLNAGMLVRINPPGTPYCSKIVMSYPNGNKSLATVSDAGPALCRQCACRFSHAAPWARGAVIRLDCRKRHASVDRSQPASLRCGAAAGRLARPVAKPSQDSREDIRFPIHHVRFGELTCAIRRIYSGTSVCAGQAHWQSTTRWK